MTTEHKNPKNQMTRKSGNSKTQKSPAKKSFNSKKAQSSRPLSNTINISEILAPLAAKHSILSAKSKEDEFEFLARETKSPSRPMDLNGATELKGTEHSTARLGDPAFSMALGMLKGILFKRDQPYRTRLPIQGAFATNGSGVLNVTTSNQSIGGVSEWSNISALFDEFFIHSITWRFQPINNLGGGVGYSAGATVTGGIALTADTQINNAGMLVCSLFNGAPTYSTASAMAANATIAIKNSSRPWKYVWRNSQRFDPRGDNVGMIAPTNIGYQGWLNTANPTYAGGAIQFRMLNDAVVGTGSAAVTLGLYIAYWDVSFRSRS